MMNGLERLRKQAGELTRRGWGLAISLLRNRDDAMDAVQQALLVATKKPQQIPRGNIWPWFARVVALEVANLRRKHGRIPAELVEDDAMDTLSGPERQFEQRELGSQLALALAELPQAQRDALMLTQYGGLSYEDAARSLGMPLGTFNHQVRRGLQRLRVRFGVDDTAIARGLIAMPVLAVPDSLLSKALEIIAAANVAAAGVSAGLLTGAGMGIKFGIGMIVAVLTLIALLLGFGRNLWPVVREHNLVARANDTPPEADNNRSIALRTTNAQAPAANGSVGTVTGDDAMKVEQTGDKDSPIGVADTKGNGSVGQADPVKPAGEPSNKEVPYIEESLSQVVVPVEPDDSSLLTRLGAHVAPWDNGEEIKVLAVCHDGKSYITAGSKLRWWDADDGTLRFGHQLLAPVHAVDVSPDGLLLVTAQTTTADHVVRFWDNRSGKLLGRLPSNDAVSQLQFSADGKWLVAASNGWRAVLAWNMHRRDEPRVFRPGASFNVDGNKVETSRFLSVNLSSDNMRLAAHCYTPPGGALVAMWDFSTGKYEGEFRFAEAGVTGQFQLDYNDPRCFEHIYHMAYTTDGALAVATVNQNCIWALGQQNKFMGCAAQVLLIDLREKKLLRTLARYELPENGEDDNPPPDNCKIGSPPVIHPGGKEVAIAGMWPDNSSGARKAVFETRIWNFDGQIVAQYAHSMDKADSMIPNLLAYDCKGERIFAACNGHVRVLRPGAIEIPLRAEQTVAHSAGVIYAEFSPDSKTFYSCDAGGTLLAWDVAIGRCKDRIENISVVFDGRACRPFALSPDGRQIVYAEALWDDLKSGARKRRSLNLCWRDLTSGMVTRQVDLRKFGNPQHLQYSRSGKSVIALSDMHGSLWVFDATSGEVTAAFDQIRTDYYYSSLAIRDDAKWLALASGDASLMNLETRKHIDLNRPKAEGPEYIERSDETLSTDVCFSADGKRIILLLQNGSLEFYEAETGAYLETTKVVPAIPTGRRCRFALPSDQSYFAIGTGGYNVETGFEISRYRMSDQKLLQRVKVRYGHLQQVVVSPDGQVFAAVSTGIRIWKTIDDPNLEQENK